MEILVTQCAALAVSLIFYTWRALDSQQQVRRQTILRERVAYMLWVMAKRVDEPSREVAIPQGSR